MPKQVVIPLRASEQVLFERKLVMLRLGKISVSGAYLTITSERVVIERQSRYGIMFGLIGALLAGLFPSKPIVIERSEITSVEQVKFGINDQVVAIKLQGDTTYTVLVKPHYVTIVEAFQKLGLPVKPLAV
jgi:hypothetical protein